MGLGSSLKKARRKIGRAVRNVRRVVDPGGLIWPGSGGGGGGGGGGEPGPGGQPAGGGAGPASPPTGPTITNVTTSTIGGFVTFYWVQKTIRVDKSLVQDWMEDYRVNVKLHNCIPLSHKQDYESVGLNAGAAGISNVWVSKSNVNGTLEFTIFVAWNAIDATVSPDEATSGSVSPYFYRQPTRNARGSIINFNGFAVITRDMTDDFNRDIGDDEDLPGNAAIGATLYPTVSFEVVGIPRGYGASNSFKPSLPVLALK